MEKRPGQVVVAGWHCAGARCRRIGRAIEGPRSSAVTLRLVPLFLLQLQLGARNARTWPLARCPPRSGPGRGVALAGEGTPPD